MTNAEWVGPEISKKREPDYEQAYMKAALEGSANALTFRTFEKMFGERPKAGTPYWLVRLAIYYAALEMGHKRFGRPMNGTDREMLRAVSKLDQNALRSNKVLWHHVYLHDLEPAEFDGREVVE